MTRRGEAKWRADAKQAATAQRHIRETQQGLRRYKQGQALRSRKPLVRFVARVVAFFR